MLQYDLKGSANIMENKKDKSPITRMGFTNIYGVKFPNVREIAYKVGEYLNIGIPVVFSHGENNNKFISDDHLYSTMYIYQDSNNPFLGYRIYGDYADYHFNGNNDDKLISNLQERQNGVLLTKFPTGVVTRGGYIIGQEMPFFPNSNNLNVYLKECSVPEIFALYKKVLLILKELYSNEIIYTDIHPGNFLVTPNSKIELIDFDSSRVHFEVKEDKVKTMIENLYIMINYLTYRFCGTKLILPLDKMSLDFDNIMEQLEEKEKQLIKK